MGCSPIRRGRTPPRRRSPSYERRPRRSPSYEPRPRRSPSYDPPPRRRSPSYEPPARRRSPSYSPKRRSPSADRCCSFTVHHSDTLTPSHTASLPCMVARCLNQNPTDLQIRQYNKQSKSGTFLPVTRSLYSLSKCIDGPQVYTLHHSDR